MARSLGDCFVSIQRKDVKLGDFQDDRGLVGMFIYAYQDPAQGRPFLYHLHKG